MVCWGCIVGGLRCVVDVVNGSQSAWGTQCMGIAGSAGFWSGCGVQDLQCIVVTMYESCAL